MRAHELTNALQGQVHLALRMFIAFGSQHSLGVEAHRASACGLQLHLQAGTHAPCTGLLACADVLRPDRRPCAPEPGKWATAPLGEL